MTDEEITKLVNTSIATAFERFAVEMTMVNATVVSSARRVGTVHEPFNHPTNDFTDFLANLIVEHGLASYVVAKAAPSNIDQEGLIEVEAEGRLFSILIEEVAGARATVLDPYGKV